MCEDQLPASIRCSRSLRQQHDTKRLQRYAGQAPVTRRSGRSEYTIARRLAFNRHLGEAVPQWAFCSITRSARAIV